VRAGRLTRPICSWRLLEAGPVIAPHNAVGVQHRHDLEDERLPQRFGDVRRPDQEVDQTLQQYSTHAKLRYAKVRRSDRAGYPRVECLGAHAMRQTRRLRGEGEGERRKREGKEWSAREGVGMGWDGMGFRPWTPTMRWSRRDGCAK
jgi:hypothetical protein